MRAHHSLSGMIRTTLLAFSSLFISFAVISCSGEDKDNPVEETDETYDAGEFNRPEFEAESALYSIPSGDSGLRSIELTASGFYIVITDAYSRDNSGQIAAVQSAPIRFMHKNPEHPQLRKQRYHHGQLHEERRWRICIGRIRHHCRHRR